MKKIIIPVMLCLLLCGCGNYEEIEDALMVSGIAVDKGVNDNYLVTVEIVNLNQGEGEPPASQLKRSEGPTVFSALENINASTSKKLFFSQARVIAISEQVAREGLINIIDVIVRDSELRITNAALVAKDCAAADLFTVAATGNPIRSYEIADLLKNEWETLSVVPEVQVYELINIVGSAGVAGVLPAFSYIKSEEEGSLTASGAAMFKNDKLVGFLDIPQAKIMTLIQGETKEGLVSQPIKTDTQEYMTVKIFDCKTDVNHKKRDGKIVMEIEMDAEVGINELTAKENIMDKKGREELMKKLEKSLEARVQGFIKQIQQDVDADIFGFGERIYKEDPKLWEEIKNRDYFSEIETVTKVKVKLRGTGFIAKSPATEDFRLKEGG